MKQKYLYKKTRAIIILFLLFLNGYISAQKIEAEVATLADGAAIVSSPSNSGGAYVNQEDGSLTFTVNITEAGTYNLLINAASPFGPKENNISVDALTTTFSLEESTDFSSHKILSDVNLTAGSHTISITSNWGWIQIDYIELEKIITNGQITKIEAESATLSDGASSVANGSSSGGFYVSTGEGNLTFDVTLAQTSLYNIYVYASAPNGPKTNNIIVDGASASFAMEENPEYIRLKVISDINLEAGAHTIQITKNWGWINIDYIELETVGASERFNINPLPVNPNATAETVSLYKFLYDNYGEKIISGVMTLESFDESNWLKQNTGKEPALLGLDFMHSGRNYNWYNDRQPIIDAKTWYERNGIPALCWHWRDPSKTTEEFYTAGTSFDISKISDPASAEYIAMLNDIDYISELLKELQTDNVPVLWRPLHEAAGGWFWWGAKGAAPLKSLWLIMYDRMVNHHGLNNLIWVWTREPNDDAWYPGDEFVDIVGRDMYRDGDHSSHILEFNDMNNRYGKKKMVALSEVGSFPDVDNLIADNAAWSWYMPWYGKYTREATYNSLALWQKMFAHDYVITLDEMPELSTYGQVLTGKYFNEVKSLNVYPSLVSNQLTIDNAEEKNQISIYDYTGQVMLTTRFNGSKGTINCSELPSGIYLVKVNEIKTFKIIKR